VLNRDCAVDVEVVGEVINFNGGMLWWSAKTE